MMSAVSPGAVVLASHDLDYLAGIFRPGGRGFVQSLSGAAQAYLALAVRDRFQKPVVWVVDSSRNGELMYRDLLTLAGGESGLHVLPPRETRPGGASELMGDRLKTLLGCLRPGRPFVVVACVQALFQSLPVPAAVERHRRELRLLQEIDPDALLAELSAAGYVLEAEVLQKGQAARRGGVLDVWPPTEDWPVRLEFFGNVLDSIRTFDPAEQRSLDRLNALALSPASEEGAEDESATFLDYLSADTIWVWSEPDSLFHHAEMCAALLPEDDPRREAIRFDRLRSKVERSFSGGELVVGMDSEQSMPAQELDLRPCEGLPSPAPNLAHPDALEDMRRTYVRDLARQAREGRRVRFFFNTDGSRDRFLELYGREFGDGAGVEFIAHPLTEGFLSDAAGMSVVAESDLYGVRKTLPGRYEQRSRKTAGREATGMRLAEWTDIQPGELVVHLDHGIGKYLGLYEIQFDGHPQEVLAVEYADKAKLYVPVSQAHLLSRYVGVGRRRPDLHALGGKRWTREKVAAEMAVRDLAGTLLETQARRSALEGHAFGSDTTWQHEFEAAFPFQETEDQHRAIIECKRDMESRQPMDRLICGDVGYGKTEVAMRAAFKAVMGGKQVAVLVPTTILAQQHYDTFIERMAAYPVTVEMLSRFRTRHEQDRVVERIGEGGVDVVIGTHRLLQKDIRFKDLGLVIIDEEQRFGVAHKEHFKRLRELVDVLTLTATPIPRTLYLSLTGAKDMSTIQTPPQDRLPVETIVAQQSDELVRGAILRELNRGGQIFYLHNRVRSIRHVRDRLLKLVPEARVETAHGQMREKELAAIMHRFVRGEFDLLLCTTIIESGVDIPNVNTILIDRADRFGMADLYQLRGRVGRYKNKAYAYLLLPRHGRLFDNARKRIGAIKRYSSLGAGFKLALRDLEIRGAGNMLGSEQSGHIAAVGFDLYCQLLKRTVARLRNEPVPPIIDVRVQLDFLDLSVAGERSENAAVLPVAYIEDENLRVGMYRKMAAAALESEVDRLDEEFRDRFGPLPEPVKRLLLMARLRMVAAGCGIQTVEVREDKLMLTRAGDYIMRRGKFPRLKSSDPTGRLKEMLAFLRACPN